MEGARHLCPVPLHLDGKLQDDHLVFSILRSSGGPIGSRAPGAMTVSTASAPSFLATPSATAATSYSERPGAKISTPASIEASATHADSAIKLHSARLL